MHKNFKQLIKQIKIVNQQNVKIIIENQILYNKFINCKKNEDNKMETKKEYNCADEVTIFDIANYIINKVPEITNMKLQKLIYYSQGYYLVKHGKRLVDNHLEAWVYGPVFPDLYIEFRKYTYNSLQKTLKGDENKLSPLQKEIIDTVIQKEGNKTGRDLSIQTHNEDPWTDAYRCDEDWEQNAISDESLIKFFKKVNK